MDPKDIEQHFNETANDNFKWADFSGFVRPGPQPEPFFILAESTGEEVRVKTPPGNLIFYGSADTKEELITLLEETLQKLKTNPQSQAAPTSAQ